MNTQAPLAFSWATTSPRFEVEIVSSLSQALAVRRDWQRLAARAGQTAITQDFDYIQSAFDLPGAARQPHVVLVREQGRLVAAWPLCIRKRAGLRFVTHLGDDTDQEMTAPLIEPGDDEADIARYVLATARAAGDVLEIYNTRHPALIAAVEAERGFRMSWKGELWIAQPGARGGYEPWIAAKSSSFRKGLRYDRKRLSARGELRSLIAPVDIDPAPVVAWLYENKRNWRRQKRIAHGPALGPTQAEFFERTIGCFDVGRAPMAGALAFCLMDGDRFVAACLCTVSGGEMTYYQTTYDDAYQLYSPGNLLIEDCLRWCCANGLAFNLGIGKAAYKLRWGDSLEGCVSYLIATSARGVPYVWRKKIEVRLRETRIKYAPAIKSAIRRVRAALAGLRRT